ncbi:Uncharacterised protein [Segatella copri]|nr:Uncharacterised protein [Segatella copri]
MTILLIPTSESRSWIICRSSICKEENDWFPITFFLQGCLH